jgi:hypothetical protein
MRRCPELAGTFDDVGGCLTQNQINVWLVRTDVHFNKPIRGSDLQLLAFPSERCGPFNPKDLGASTPSGNSILDDFRVQIPEKRAGYPSTRC